MTEKVATTESQVVPHQLGIFQNTHLLGFSNDKLFVLLASDCWPDREWLIRRVRIENQAVIWTILPDHSVSVTLQDGNVRGSDLQL